MRCWDLGQIVCCFAKIGGISLLVVACSAAEFSEPKRLESGGMTATFINGAPLEGSSSGGRLTDGVRGSGGKGAGGNSGRGGTVATGGKGLGGNTGQGGTIATGGKGAGGNQPQGGRATGGTEAGGSLASGGRTASSACPTVEEGKFSFFLMSRVAVMRESGNLDGFGGDLGGLVGADAICQRVAESVSACQSNKVWHAFLSTSTENAIDRIGQGPWYDRLGRLVANSKSELLNDRPPNADPTIINDLPNEFGTPNHNPDGTGLVDNHEILTGSGTDGRLYTQTSSTSTPGSSRSCGDGEAWTIQKATCWDWTSSAPQGCPRVGHSWPREGSGINWISVWNEGGCAPGGELTDNGPAGGGLDGTRRVGSAGGYGGWYCLAVVPTP